MVLVLECLLFDELVHQKDPQLHYHGAYTVALHHVLPKRLLFRAQSLGMSMAVKPETLEISKDSERNEEKVDDFSATDHIFLGFPLKSGTLLAVFEPCSATALSSQPQ
ncbi:hypothetical protein NMR33_002748 [Vibrio cholerae]|uniref:hypothetical protein n=1 Tax=Vibrio cholerae TaxID=666 RepID=UPI0005C74F99|nr:hypothetical protein [Vibrio cholerae]EJL6342745.1 hypothetical protein [Vibrio cholerae]EKF9473309.1 hypothetical protein [Vibrio cholerae]EKF9727023.1 hypothetical protein [Vibrio cholerae]TXY43135.1 hypothetical protein FXE84_06195 [Vibrio cholerae]GHW98759.1 hypothetical protein VCSRO105_2859 [Vibrio cholerae]